MQGKYEKKDMYSKHASNDCKGHKEEMKNEIKSELKKEMEVKEAVTEVEA